MFFKICVFVDFVTGGHKKPLTYGVFCWNHLFVRFLDGEVVASKSLFVKIILPLVPEKILRDVFLATIICESFRHS